MRQDPGVNDIRRQAGPHVFVDGLEALEVTDDDRHHLERSLRLRDGDPLTASDGQGAWRAVLYGAQLKSNGPINFVGPPEYEVGLAIALTKSGKPELVVQKATELGVDRIMLFHAGRSVVRWDRAKAARGITRLRRVAREAAMQSRQLRVPAVELADGLGAIGPVGLVRADFGGVTVGPEHRLIAIGPEGGWSDAEIQEVPAAVDLGPSVLRAETAAVVAAAHMVLIRQA